MFVHLDRKRWLGATLLTVLVACGADDPAPVPAAPDHTADDGSSSTGDDDSDSHGDDGAPAADNKLDAGRSTGARDAARPPTTDAKVAVDASTAAPSAASDATVDSPATRDGAVDATAPERVTDAGAPPATVHKPTFKKTRCIDPSKLKPDSELNFPCDEIDVWVVVPSACLEHSCGLIFNIHGGGMSDHATMDQATHMIALGSQAGYIVVHPHKGTWSVSTDKNTVFGFLQQVVEAFDVDPKRVHSTGYSQGGQISWALGCEHADVIASIAPAEEINRVSDCWKTAKRPVRELPVLFAYGKKDSIGGGYDAAKTTVSQFVAATQMTGPETIAGKDGSAYFRQRWTSPGGNVLEFISHNYTSTGVGGILAGHCLPMADGSTFVSCSKPVDYDWGKEALTFFQAHPMP